MHILITSASIRNIVVYLLPFLIMLCMVPAMVSNPPQQAIGDPVIHSLLAGGPADDTCG